MNNLVNRIIRLKIDEIETFNFPLYELIGIEVIYDNIKFELCDTYEETVLDSDVIISAVTNATEDFADDECYKEGCTVIPIMSLGFQNCDLFFDKVFTDDIDQIRGFKYFDKFKSIANNTDVLLGESEGRTNDKERILVYNYGLAVHEKFFFTEFIINFFFESW